MQVSFIVPLYNCLPLTRVCVETLQRSLPGRLEHEIILIDNGSHDGTAEWLSSLPPPCRVVRNETNLGYARANNQGAALARGEVLCLINNDLVFRRRWFEPMLHVWRSLGPQAGAVGNVQRTVRDRTIDHAGIFINHQGKPEHDRSWYPWPRQQRLVTAVTGACLMVRRQSFADLGGFDERFVNGGEDIDLCFRLNRLGLRNAVALRSCVLHHVSASAGRKLRDEANSHLLATKWRQELSQLSYRGWCWHHLQQHWSGSQSASDWRQAMSLLSYALHLTAHPPEAVVRGFDTLMNAEFQRWRRMLDTESAA